MLTIRCPRCPLCDQPPMFIIGFTGQAACGDDGCPTWFWDVTATLAENLTDTAPVRIFRNGVEVDPELADHWNDYQQGRQP